MSGIAVMPGKIFIQMVPTSLFRKIKANVLVSLLNSFMIVNVVFISLYALLYIKSQRQGSTRMLRCANWKIAVPICVKLRS